MDLMKILKEIEKMASAMCNEYCRYSTDENLDYDDLWEKHCSKCPLQNVE